MTKEEIVEEIAEGIFQYSNCVEEIVENTIEHMSLIVAEVRASVQEKVVSRSINSQEARENFAEHGWY